MQYSTWGWVQPNSERGIILHIQAECTQDWSHDIKTFGRTKQGQTPLLYAKMQAGLKSQS